MHLVAGRLFVYPFVYLPVCATRCIVCTGVGVASRTMPPRGVAGCHGNARRHDARCHGDDGDALIARNGWASRTRMRTGDAKY